MTNESLLAPATYLSTSLVQFPHEPGSLCLSIRIDDVRVEGVSPVSTMNEAHDFDSLSNQGLARSVVWHSECLLENRKGKKPG
jgi:hypothetical protein